MQGPAQFKINPIYARLAYRMLGIVPTRRPFVFGIGLSKTGTTSLNDALELLGYRAVHLPPTIRVEDGEIRLDWPWWLSKFDAATDISISAVFPELYRRFPNARFIYTTRALEPWLDSCRRHFTLELAERRVEQKNFFVLELCKKLYGTILYDPDLFRAAFERHDAAVRAFFRDKQLLTLDITKGEGWEPLCAHLGRPAPAIPFPFSNRARGSNEATDAAGA